ncbi:MAG: KpsF/GutQ family sugar-phosphate isomerase [Burkholderiaceae bacterium]
MDLLASARRVIEIEGDGLQRIAAGLDQSFVDAVEQLKKTLERKGKIVVVGVGKSENIGLKIAATLNSTGASTVVLDSQNALHGDLGILSDGDIILALSYSGETEELINLLPFIKRFEVKVISLTGNTTSTLAKFSDTVLDTSVEREACPLNLAPTSSSTAMLVMGDALAMVLLETRGFTENDFARFHPGGSLGKALLTKVRDIMRSDQQLPTVDLNADVFAAIDAMNKARAGACLILNQNGTLGGIFTHGDFARCFRKDPLLGDKPVADLMTKEPISIKADDLAVEVLKTLGQSRIDDLVVLDEHGKPVGLVDTQDLARLKIV